MAGSSFGGVIKLKGESEYRKALSSITSNLKVLTSELKVVTSQYDKNDKSVESLSSQNEVLTKKIVEQKEKVITLSKALSDAIKETGENSETTKYWRVQLNNAQSDLNKLKVNVDNNTKSIREFGEEEEKTSEKTSMLGDIIKGNLISNAIQTGISTLISGIKKLGSAMMDVGKSALNSFADYEQLVGGVDTLFKESSSKVQNYANNAYKTAGLSANEYMETVTSFSASLLQSLNGDTAKSAEIADMAIIDMSDNANKMGTSMESIQNAYQGFAKQNYTMLDNLKLGYGGTKEEMERLIADANRVKEANGEMADLSIESFADVTEAIHLIQTEMGITGTTAEEASSTIQGSVSSMKSAWHNLLTGIASDNADLDKLLGDFISSVSTSFNNILPVVNRIIDNLISTITKNLPTILKKGSELLNTLIKGITDKLPEIIPAAIEILNTLINCIIENLPLILEAGITIITELISGIGEALPNLIPQMIEAVITMVTGLLDNIDMIIDAGIKLIMGLVDGIVIAIPKLIEKIPEIIEKLLTAISENLPKIIEAGITLIIKFSEGLIKAIPTLVKAIPKIIWALINGIGQFAVDLLNKGGELLGWIKDGIVSGISKIGEVGTNLVKGLWNGIKNAKDWVINKVKEFGSSVVDGLKEFFGIKSPSKLFEKEIGLNLAKGIGVGFESEMKNVNSLINSSIPKTYDFDTSVNVNRNPNENQFLQSDIKNNLSNSTFNFYIQEVESPADYAREVRNNLQYIGLLK